MMAVLILRASTGLEPKGSGSSGVELASGPYLNQLRELMAAPWARRVYAATFCEFLLVFGCMAFLRKRPANPTTQERHF